MSEQLTIDFFEALEADNHDDIPRQEQISYEPLDLQLARLLQEQNGIADKELKDATLQISKQTREGQIFIPCDVRLQTELLKTNVVGKVGEYKPLIIDHDYLYLNRYFSYQESLAAQIKTRIEIDENSSEISTQLDRRLNHYFDDENLSETKEINYQKEAAKQALTQSFLVLSGGPGTGKTTTVSRILALLVEQYNELEKSEVDSGSHGFRILLAAPTGKAAVRMLDSIQEAQSQLNLDEDISKQMPSEAHTIHKLLGYQHNSVQFKHNAQNPLIADVVLVDEASMIDIALMSKLVAAVPKHTKLILIGDKDQLSSVEIGSVFTDICNSLKDSRHLISLQKNWRFSRDSGIGQLAKATNDSNSSKLLNVLRSPDIPECQIVPTDGINRRILPSQLIAPWTEYFTLLNDRNASIKNLFKAFNQYRVLCTLRKGYNGSHIMSDRIEDLIFKQGLIKTNYQHKTNKKNWYHGRPIMITQNSYNKGLFNGDTGIALEIDGQLKVYFPDTGKDTFKSISPVRLPTHETTWAMTIHKSQGSEFNQVTLILPHEVMPLLTKQLIYTGITRAKKGLSIIADEEVLKAGVKSEMVKATQIETML